MKWFYRHERIKKSCLSFSFRTGRRFKMGLVWIIEDWTEVPVMINDHLIDFIT